MPLPIPSASLPELLAPWLAMIGFGAYHGLNPGMGWLFALSLGLQQRSERAIWRSMAPIALGHAASLLVVAAIVGVAIAIHARHRRPEAFEAIGTGVMPAVRTEAG